MDEEGKALTGAEFKLEKVLADKSTEEIDRLTVSEGTKFTFKGLDDGEYILTETKAPEGYLAAAPITFKVTAAHEIEWNGDAATRENVLTVLSGDVTTGKIFMDKLETAADKSALTGSVKNAEEPTFEKKVKDTNDSTGETSDWQDSADYDIGPCNI